jgi:hypothetical protein
MTTPFRTSNASFKGNKASYSMSYLSTKNLKGLRGFGFSKLHDATLEGLALPMLSKTIQVLFHSSARQER